MHAKLPDVDALDSYHVMLALAALSTRAAHPPSHEFMLDLSVRVRPTPTALNPPPEAKTTRTEVSRALGCA